MRHSTNVASAVVILLNLSLLSLAAFTPPPAFKNTNLLRTVDVSKGYVRETIAVILENISDSPQDEYYVPIPKEELPTLSYFEAKDKKEGKICVTSRVTDADDDDDNVDTKYGYYKISLPKAVEPKGQLTLQIAFGLANNIDPKPAIIGQADKQHLKYTGPRYAISSYPTDKQKTKVKFPTAVVPEYSQFEAKADGTNDPAKAGSMLTYGPYEKIAANAASTIDVRFEHSGPVIRMDKLERDIEISHWGGNLAVEERYWMTNAGAKLRDQFSRVVWATTAYTNSPTTAIKQLTFGLIKGSKDPYFTDEIGNVSTSRFRPRQAHLELKPRYPVFGGWNYSFVVGWNNELEGFVRKISTDKYALKVPFLEGPKEAATYSKVEVTVILPEGATDVEYSAPIPLLKEETYLHKTFMDTIGRTAIKMTVNNVVDELKNRDIYVTYTYTTASALRKPLVFVAGIFTCFFVTMIVGRIDVSIGK